MKKIVSVMLVFLISVSLVSIFFVSSVAGEEKVTLRFWGTAAALRDRGRRIIWHNFEKENPGVKVEFEGIPWGDYTEKILTGGIAGTLPDGARYGFVARFASRGLLLPLGTLIEGPDGIDTNEYFEAVFPDPSIMWDGEVYALPFSWEGAPAAFYNKDILKEAGVVPPTTWSELEVAVKRLTQKTSAGEVERYGMLLSEYSYVIDGFVGTNGGSFTDVPGHRATRATYSTPENVEGFQFLVDLAKDEYLLPLSGEMESKYFLEGKVAMWYTCGSNAYTFRPEIFPDFNWGATRCPVPEGKPIVVPANFADSAWIFKTTKHPELAWKLLKAYAWKEGAPLVWIHKFGAIPPFKDILDENTLNSSYYPFQFVKELREMAEMAIGNPSKMPGIDRWHIRGKEIQDLEVGQYELMLRGEKSVEEALNYLDQKVSAMLPETK